VSGGCALAQDGVGSLRNVLDLNARHGAILAPTAPECKLAVPCRVQSRASAIWLVRRRAT
jgi:hypothetical protein